MVETINERVSVITIYDRDKGIVTPYSVRWQGRTYKITKIGYHHKERRGRYVYHIFSVCNDSIAFKLVLDTETLFWFLEEVSDGSSN